ncbi:hypothetical protein DPMN_136441 [Dreissena polymorpha]|uniref:Uncharacterized protein n=1 Tax=Dreissena polymorpha TaxID=45954 RepID=A0A9D4G3C9_DREPO|nr:hypothetical protein DPMN_136441 [Dreissena polymorpha]
MIQKAVPGIQVIVPEVAGLAVLKGAVMFGNKPDIISSRVMNYTYGIGGSEFYYETKQPAVKKIYENGKWKVEKAVVIFARVDDEVLVNSKMTLTAAPTTHGTKHRHPTGSRFFVNCLLTMKKRNNSLKQHSYSETQS